MSKLFRINYFLLFFVLSCTAVVQKEDILLQSKQIKESNSASIIQPTPITGLAQPMNVPTIPVSEPAIEQLTNTPTFNPAIEPIIPKLSPLPDQEKLVYKAKYLGITIGTFIITNYGKTMYNGKQAYHFELEVKTLALFSQAFRTKTKYVSYMDAQKFVVLRHEEYVKDILESAVDFNYESHTATYKNFNNKREQTVPIPDQLLDVLSGGFYLRMIPWELGDTAELNIYADEKVYEFMGLLQSKETINLPVYEDQEVYRLKPYLFLDGKQVTKLSAEVFFSTTDSKKSLRALCRTRLGTVSVLLTEGFQ